MSDSQIRPPEETLREKAGELPDRPGVYLFRDEEDEVLYVGKASSLRSRVKSYFLADASRTLKEQTLVRRIDSFETFVLESEGEALLLEWNLIKEHRPRYNVQLRDDKSYPYVKVTVNEPFPRVFVTRQLEQDGARYFGPFTDVGAMRRTLRTLKGMYHVRTCHYHMPDEMPERPCLDYHLGRCEAPCAGYQSQEEYREMIEEILGILSGRTGEVKERVRTRMEEAAEAMEFEQAGELRDVLKGLESLERQRTAVDFRGGDRDVLGFRRADGVACGALLKVREGRLLGREVHYVHNLGDADGARVTGAFVKGFYLRQADPAPELLVPTDFEDRALVEEYLSVRRNGKVEIRVPRRGRKRKLLELAEENAGHLMQREEELARAPAEGEEDDRVPGRSAGPADGQRPGGREGGPPPRSRPEPRPGERAGRRLADALDLPAPVRSLVCFDVSTLQGADSTGSAVWLLDGAPLKEEYRHYRIEETPPGDSDDYAMMQEIVGRYFHRRVREGEALPDLVLVDGGRAQLGAARQAMESAGVSDLPLAALAKQDEEVFLPERRDPVRLSRHDPALHWLQRARDEAHRFALRYNRKLRRRRTLRSRLGEIPGVGPAREQELLTKFGSVDAVREASEEELAETPGVGPATARRIRAEFEANR